MKVMNFILEPTLESLVVLQNLVFVVNLVLLLQLSMKIVCHKFCGARHLYVEKQPLKMLIKEVLSS